jgi:putative flippase GtrA
VPWTFLRYLAVGTLNTCVGLGTIYIALYWLNLSDPLANLTGYSVGILLSFALNKFWTFSATGAAGTQFIKFFLVNGAAYMINLATVMSCIKILGANHYVAQAVGVVPYTIIGYLGSRYFAFRS